MTDIVSNSQDKIESGRMHALKEKILFCERESEINRVQFLLRTILIIIVTLSLIMGISYIRDIFAPKDFEGQLYSAFDGAKGNYLIIQIIHSLTTTAVLLSAIFLFFQQLKKRAHQWNGEVFIKRSKTWFVILSILYVLGTCIQIIDHIGGAGTTTMYLISGVINTGMIGVIIMDLLGKLIQLGSIFYIGMGIGILGLCLLKKGNNQRMQQ